MNNSNSKNNKATARRNAASSTDEVCKHFSWRPSNERTLKKIWGQGMSLKNHQNAICRCGHRLSDHRAR